MTQIHDVSQFESAITTLPGAASAAVTATRQAGLQKFLKTGLPTAKQEAWKYTNLRGLKDHQLSPVMPADGMPENTATLPAPLQAFATFSHRMVFVDGRFAANLSCQEHLPVGAQMTATSLSLQAGTAPPLPKDMACEGLIALNQAMMQDGVMLRLSAGTQVEAPILLLFIWTSSVAAGASHFLRHHIVAEKDSRAEFVEMHYGAATTSAPMSALSHQLMTITGAAGSRLRRLAIYEHAHSATHLDHSEIRLADRAVYSSVAVALGGALARLESHVTLAGQAAECYLNGLYALDGRQHCDFSTRIDHAEVETVSQQLFKSVIGGHARGVFQGNVTVRPDAQRINGHQLCKSLLLSDTAEIDAKPELRIEADDVKCSHGATAGELDEEALFYLQSRGLPDIEAKKLLITSFLAEVIDEIGDESLAELVAGRLKCRLESLSDMNPAQEITEA